MIIKNKLISLVLILTFLGCTNHSKVNNNVARIFKDWKIATYMSLQNKIHRIIDEGADSISVIDNTLPIFKKYITSSRYEYFNSFNKSNIKPFEHFYSSDFIIIEIFREDNCHTKVMHIVKIVPSSKNVKAFNFVRSCYTSGVTKINKLQLSRSVLKKLDGFIANFKYKGGFRNYTGIITYIKKGKFRCLPLLYLSDKDIDSLNKITLGLE